MIVIFLSISPYSTPSFPCRKTIPTWLKADVRIQDDMIVGIHFNRKEHTH